MASPSVDGPEWVRPPTRALIKPAGICMPPPEQFLSQGQSLRIARGWGHSSLSCPPSIYAYIYRSGRGEGAEGDPWGGRGIGLASGWRIRIRLDAILIGSLEMPADLSLPRTTLVRPFSGLSASSSLIHLRLVTIYGALMTAAVERLST